MWLQTTSVALAFIVVTTTADNALKLQTQIPERRLKTEAATFLWGNSHCECKSTRRPCLFIHGEQSSDNEKTLQDSSKKFGDMSGNAPCCESLQYVSMNTIKFPWHGAELQKKVCGFSLSLSSSSDKRARIIKDTILVTHSMGALILAGALANNTCSMDKSTTWVSMGAPMKGTMVSNLAQDICTDDDTEAFHQLLSILGGCPVNTGLKSLAYMNGKYSNVKLNKAYEAAQAAYVGNVSAVMCSNHNAGIMSADIATYKLLGSSAHHGTNEHDGVVTLESCRGGLAASKFTNKPTGPYYVTRCNHADLAFLHGDAFFNKQKQPVQWFKCLL